MCPLHSPGHNMNSCKIIMVQSKAMKSTWSTARGGGAGRVRSQVAKKCPTKGKEPNDLVANAVKAFLKPNKQNRDKDSSDSGSEDEQEHYNFEILKIGGE